MKMCFWVIYGDVCYVYNNLSFDEIYVFCKNKYFIFIKKYVLNIGWSCYLVKWIERESYW